MYLGWTDSSAIILVMRFFTIKLLRGVQQCERWECYRLHSLSASGRQGPCKRSIFKSMVVSSEIPRWLPEHWCVFTWDYVCIIFRFDFWNNDVCFFVWMYQMKPFKLKVEGCFAFLFLTIWAFDLFVTGRRHLIFERALAIESHKRSITSAR